ncbi:MAG TPA: DUF3108 domain-containing protein [Gammaproteobacteria bacterium]
MTRRVLEVCALPLLAFAAAAGHAQDDIATYEAVYDVEYRGRRLGRSEFEVRHDAATGRYVFASRTEARGLVGRLASPDPTVEHSEFVLDGDRIRPLEYRYEDGTRGGDDDLTVVFDWDAGVARVTDENGTRELPIEPGVLDRGSLQSQLMRDLATAGEPGRYRLVDDDGVQEYGYAAQGTEEVRTGAGMFEARVYVQQREGSSRSTWLWVAPALGYLPVRIEQRRDGETRTSFLLQSIEGLGAAR